MASPIYDTIIRVEERHLTTPGSAIPGKSIMQAKQLLTQLSPAENLYALLLYVFMLPFQKELVDLLRFCLPLLTNPSELIKNTNHII